MHHFDFLFKTKDNLNLYGQGWFEKSDAPKILCIIHGLGEHSGRYKDVARFFCQHGYIVATFDRRGNGKSEGRKGHIPSLKILFDDIDIFLNEIQNKFQKNAKIILYGHSLGGIFVLDYIMNVSTLKIRAAIASSPAFLIPFKIPLWQQILGRIANIIFPSLTNRSGLNLNELSRDPTVKEQYIEDTLNHDRISARTFCLALDTGRRLLRQNYQLTLPTLLMHGDKDYITSCNGSIQFKQNSNEKCTLKIWEDAYHELHNEINKEDIFNYMLNWINKNCN